jgi:hypothetical protein
MENNQDIPIAYEISYQPEIPSAIVINTAEQNNIISPFNRPIIVRRRLRRTVREKSIFCSFSIFLGLTIILLFLYQI